MHLKADPIAIAVLGTANLFGLVEPNRSLAVLLTALDAGYRAVDTSPSYGYDGATEAVLARVVAGRDGLRITSKVGLRPSPTPTRLLRAAKLVARRLPRGVQQRLRARQGPATDDRFGRANVRASVERSLRRLGRIDRLLLHEVHPRDLTDDLLAELDWRRSQGDVAQVGVATHNLLTAACLDRAPDLLTTVNISVAPTAPSVTLPPTTEVVGHGVFGAGASDLAWLLARMRSRPQIAARWQAAAAGTSWSGVDGLAAALLTSAAEQTAGLIVATSQPKRVGWARGLIEQPDLLPDRLAALLDTLVTSATHPPLELVPS